MSCIHSRARAVELGDRGAFPSDDRGFPLTRNA
ncbi:hypothetical protein ENSA7_05930 [Enhygromyxa salina]|uniref:Uncharacterized protein n=1 Tax=Enhygromyxa salina TaxID=215803 RepID=A0A2S9YX70_9BACT|nr:hypothetical protein ENSA7_05930 [Enhygromyxa salina]